MPEAAKARELAMCFTAIALVTDLDAGVEGSEGVTQAEVLDVFARNVERLRSLVERAVSLLRGDDAERGRRCRSSLDGHRLPFDLP